MNPYFQQSQLSASQLQQQQNLAQNFPQMQTGFGQQPYGIPNPFQGSAGWPRPYVMPGYQYPFQMGQIAMQASYQAQSNQAISQTPSTSAPPLPASKPPSEQAPLPPPPEDVSVRPAPPPPVDEPVNEGNKQLLNAGMKSKTIGIERKDEQNSNVNNMSAISPITVSKQVVHSNNDDLETLQSQQKQLEVQMKQYQSEYQKWFKEFSLWRKQHQNHPDQKKYIEYQQKYQKLIEQQQQALKEQYVELQNRIKKKQENDKSGSVNKAQVEPSPYSLPRGIHPERPSSQQVPEVSIVAYTTTNDSIARRQIAGNSQAYQTQQGPQILPVQKSVYNVPVSNKSEAFQPQNVSNIPKGFDNRGTGQYQNARAQQQKDFQFQSEPGSQQPQVFASSQQQSQHSSASSYNAQMKPQGGLQHQRHVQQQQTIDAHVPSHNQHMQQNAPSNREMQVIGSRNQDNLVNENHSQPQDRKGVQHSQNPAQYQSPFRQSFLNENSAGNPRNPRFQAPFPQQGPHRQPAPQNVNAGIPQQRPFNQQQSFQSQPRSQMSMNKNENFQQLSSNVSKTHPMTNTPRLSNARGPQSQPTSKNKQISTTSNKSIPSLMSQEIPRKDYYDMDLSTAEDIKGDKTIEMPMHREQFVKPDSKFGTHAETAMKDSSELMENRSTKRRSMTEEDFTSDDITGIDDWESQDKQPPLSPRSRLQQKTIYTPVEVSKNVPSSHPTPLVPSLRPNQQRPQVYNENKQQFNLNNQLKPRVNQGPLIRHSLNQTGASLMALKSGTRAPAPGTSGPDSSKAIINSAPPVDQPMELDSKENITDKQGPKSNAPANARSDQSAVPEFSKRMDAAMPRAPFAQGQPRASLMQSSVGAPAQRMVRPAETRGTPFTAPQGKVRLPSLMHQRQPPNIPSYKKMNCRNFPNCRFKAGCHNKHPQCPNALYCDNSNCIYDHPQLSRQEIEGIQEQMKNQASRLQTSDELQAADVSTAGNKENIQQRRRSNDYGGNVPEDRGVYNRDHAQMSNEYGKPDFNQNQDDAYYDEVNYARQDRPPPQYPSGTRYDQGYKMRPPGGPQEAFPGNKKENERSGFEGSDVSHDTSRGDLTKNDSTKALGVVKTDGQANDRMDSSSSHYPQDQGEARRFVKGNEAEQENEKQADLTANKDRVESRDMEQPRQYSYEDTMSASARDDYWERDRYGQEGSERRAQFYDRGADWYRKQERGADYDNSSFQHDQGEDVRRRDEQQYGIGTDYPEMRDNFARMPMKDVYDRPPMRDDPGRYPHGIERDHEDYLPRDYSVEPPFRDEHPRVGEWRGRSHRPVSPPRRESFREQLEFEKRYRDWERQHFPIDDPTREWEYELRRRELLGASVAAANRPVPDYPPREYDPYEREPAYGRPPFDGRHRDSLDFNRDAFIDRSRETLRPAVFDYDHARKIGLYDVDPWKINDADKPALDSEAPIANESQRPLSPRPPSPLESTLRRRRDSLDRGRSSERLRGSPSRRSRSPKRAHSPRRRSRSPLRRSSSRRSPSPRRRRPSPSRSRHRHDSREHSRSRESDRSREGERRRQDISYTAIERGYDDRRDVKGQIDDPYCSRYGDSKPLEIKPKQPEPDTVPIQDVLDPPGRLSRPKQIVIILRGPPGCGKTHIAKIIKDKEVSHKAPAPRILALDDYFIQETDVYEKDPDTGKKIKVKKMEYVYEEEMEPAYRVSLLKSFNKTLDNGYFPMVIIDAVNDKVEHFQKFWSDGKHKGFEVYVAEMHGDAQDCAEKNIHNWTQEKIQKMLDHWESTPYHFKRLDVRSLVQDASIKEVEMEEVEPPVIVEESTKEKSKEDDDDDDDEDLGTFHIPQKSKWEETKDEQLAKLDGISHSKSKKKGHMDMLRNDDDDDYYDDDPYDEREEDMRIGKKRVRWADIEERKQLEHRKRIGFCIGTDWSVLTDPNAQVPL